MCLNVALVWRCTTCNVLTRSTSTSCEEEPLLKKKKRMGQNALGTFAAEATGELEVLGLEAAATGVDGAQVAVLEQGHQISFGGLLQREHCSGLPAQVALVVLQVIEGRNKYLYLIRSFKNNNQILQDRGG